MANYTPKSYVALEDVFGEVATFGPFDTDGDADTFRETLQNRLIQVPVTGMQGKMTPTLLTRKGLHTIKDMEVVIEMEEDDDST